MNADKLHFKQLTEAQKKFVASALEDFWEVFVAGDADLIGSVCECCADKRALLVMVKAAGEPSHPRRHHGGPPSPAVRLEQLGAILKALKAEPEPPPGATLCSNPYCNHPAHGDSWCEAPATGVAAGNRCLCYPGYGKGGKRP